MVKVFYDHLIVHEEIIAELDRFTIAVDEREELVSLIDQTLHTQIINVILTHLPKKKHKEFLTRFHQFPDDEKLLDYLRVETGIDIERAIRDQAVGAKKELLAEINRAKKR